MKKVLTVLAVLVMVISCVFADEVRTNPNGSAKILIDAIISSQYPAYQLKATSVTTTSGTAGTITTAVSKVAAQPTAGLVDVTTDTLLSADVTVEFAIEQIKTAKCFDTYYITVTATNLILMNSEKTAAATASDLGMTADEFAAAVTSFAVDNDEPEVTKADNVADLAKGVTQFAAADNKLTVTYIGGLKATEANPETVGTFSCTWTHDELAIPGTYEATVQIAVAAK